VEWLAPGGHAMAVTDWERPEGVTLGMVLKTIDNETGDAARLAILFNRSHETVSFSLPGEGWASLHDGSEQPAQLHPRMVAFYLQS
jgi:glycogen operon protein